MTSMAKVAGNASTDAALYRTIWRWHFYAGLFVLPFILILSVTGSIYLFKPQIDRWEERAWQGLPVDRAVSADRQRQAAVEAIPGARFNAYRLPDRPGDAAMIQLILPDGTTRQMFVSPEGEVVGSLTPDSRISETVARIHGSLMLGRYGDWLVELAASWTIVMILTGLYLGWPRPFRAAGTLWPRLSQRGRPLLKDIHRVIGFWIAALVLVMLASGLPWAGVWGSAFKWVRAELGLMHEAQAWKVGAGVDHLSHDHDHEAMMQAAAAPQPPSLPLAYFVDRARAEGMAFPVIVLPPNAQQRFGPPTGNVWTIKSETQNRPLVRQVSYDPVTGAEQARSDFTDRHVVDRVVNTGIAWHEGQLFGVANQILGVLTAIALIAISVLGVMMWLKRRPAGQLGAPRSIVGVRKRWIVAAIVLLAILLPMFALSLLVLAGFEAGRAGLARLGRKTASPLRSG